MNEAKVFVVDDDTAFRESSCFLLEGLGYNAEAIGDPADAVEQLPRIQGDVPCCVLLDVRMPGMSGLDVHDALNTQCPHLPIIYMTGHADVPLAVAAMRKGALTFLEKPLDADALIEALDQALSDEHQARRRPTESDDEQRCVRAELARLRPREQQVLDQLRAQCSSQQMADNLCVSIKTIEHHRRSLLKRFGVRNAGQLMTVLHEAGVER